MTHNNNDNQELELLRYLAIVVHRYGKGRLHNDMLYAVSIANKWYGDYEKERLKKRGRHNNRASDKAT
jgi:hypothetical protein